MNKKDKITTILLVLIITLGISLSITISYIYTLDNKKEDTNIVVDDNNEAHVDVDKLNITAQAIDPNVMVKIIGNNNFVEGENIVQIEVTYDGADKKVYTIVVDKEGDNKNKADKNRGIWDNTYVIIGGIVVGILLFGLIVGIIWFLSRDKKENN